jgi:hypothetical protein
MRSVLCTHKESLGDEDGFDWPVDELGRCLALAVFREQAKQTE